MLHHNRLLKIFKIVAILLPLLTWYACTKYKDPAKPDVNLERRYCNNPLAFNYNWNFPGIADSSICLFPIDKFKGAWLFTDSVFTPDATLVEVLSKTLTFSATEDTLMQHMSVTGWCSGSSIAVTANKYGRALSDTLIEFSPGAQMICGDTLSGSFYTYPDSVLLPATMKIDFTQSTIEGTRYHRGSAIKQ